jgi:glycosyltransferase involved in cell wall biosynthesis
MFGLFVKKHAEAASIYNSIDVLYVQGISSMARFSKNEILNAPNLKTYIYYYRNTNYKLCNFIRYWFCLFAGFFKIYREKGMPNIIHVHILTRLAVFAFLLKMMFNVPYFITEHWSRYLNVPGTYKGKLRKMLGRIAVKNAKAIFPVSINLEIAMKSHGLYNANYHIIPNVVDDIFFREKKSTTNNKTIFIHVSTFDDKSKNISGILRSIKTLSGKTQDFEFWFVGDGSDFDSLKRYADTLMIPIGLYAFLGLKQNEELVQIYHQADFMVIFSNFENIPVVLNEALVCGLPVIATNVGGIKEIVNEENGIIIESGDENLLAETLLNAINNTTQFDKERIMKSASRFSYREVGKLISKFYNSP